MTYSDIIHFWFTELEPTNWFVQNDQIDQTIRERFSEIHDQATKQELRSWRGSALGSLAEIIVLDQFSRNMFRDSDRAYEFDSQAIQLTYLALDKKFDSELTTQQRAFLYMPLMHSEELIDHDLAVKLFNQTGLENNYQYELQHRDIIQRFGRYPHRNQVLNRESTSEETAFLTQANSSF
jgi:uncharacterized protein (DUF924 family)